jgi:hypothetical protein
MGQGRKRQNTAKTMNEEERKLARTSIDDTIRKSFQANL